jgi:hypothetical protein
MHPGRLHLAGIFRKRQGVLIFTFTNPKPLLKEEIVGDLQYGPPLLPQDREHQVAVDRLAFEVFGQEFHLVTKPERVPERQKQRRGDVSLAVGTLSFESSLRVYSSAGV